MDQAFNKDGSTREGLFLGNNLTGKGKRTDTNGDIYEGDWVEGQEHGKGKYVWADGDIYEGDWVEGREHGKGKYVWADGDIYEGDWVEGQPHGKGKFNYEAVLEYWTYQNTQSNKKNIRRFKTYENAQKFILKNY